MQPVEFQANASIHGVIKHLTKFDEPDDGPVFRRQCHLSHWVGVIKVHYVDASLIVTPEDARRQGDARHCRAKARCPAVDPDLEYRRSDREERDRNFAHAECRVQRQRAIKKINCKYGAKTMTYDQKFVCIGAASRCDDLRGQSIQSLIEDPITLSNIFARKTPI